jgi:hypothetical protein
VKIVARVNFRGITAACDWITDEINVGEPSDARKSHGSI